MRGRREDGVLRERELITRRQSVLIISLLPLLLTLIFSSSRKLYSRGFFNRLQEISFQGQEWSAHQSLSLTSSGNFAPGKESVDPRLMRASVSFASR